MHPEINVDVTDSIGWIRFNRPKSSNAVRPSTMQGLCEGIDYCVSRNDARAIVITGNGKHFAAGADLNWLAELAIASRDDVHNALYEWFVGATRRLWRCPKPTLAAVNGHAISVGCEVALACDIRIGTANTTFQESWLRLGLLAPLGGSVLLPRMIGLARAKEMFLTARAIAGQEASAIGLLTELVPEEELLARAEQRAGEMAAWPQRSYRLAKESVQRPLEADLEREWQANVLAQSSLICSDEFREQVKKLARR